MSEFTRTLFCAGFGGQGVMVLGQLVAYGGMREGRQVTWLPSYGPEMRGGTANCSVIVSDSPIGSPFLAEADAVVALNQPSLDKYESMVKPGGVLVYNSDIAKYTPTRNDIKVLAVPASKIATEVCNERALNVITLGALLPLFDIISDESARAVIQEKLGSRKPHLAELNAKAYELGRKVGLA